MLTGALGLQRRTRKADLLLHRSDDRARLRREPDRRRRGLDRDGSEAGKYLVTNTPEPADISYDAAKADLFGSLETEVLHFKKETVKKGKKVYPYIESTGCTKGARPYTITYTATESTSGSPSVGSGTVKGSASCG